MKDIVKQAQPIIILLAICGVIVAGISWFMSGTSSNSSVELIETNDEIPGPVPAEEIKAYNVDITNKSNPIAVLETNKGTVEIELFQDWMPITAGNFIKLAKEGFYDGTKFHRVIDGFMIQGGDPITKTDEVLRYGTGGPGYTILDEFITADLLTNIRGTIAMANSGPESGGSQFFINLADNRHLDFNIPDPNNSSHPVFGHVVKGMNVVDEIGKASTTPMNLPLEDITIEKVTIRN